MDSGFPELRFPWLHSLLSLFYSLFFPVLPVFSPVFLPVYFLFLPCFSWLFSYISCFSLFTSQFSYLFFFFRIFPCFPCVFPCFFLYFLLVSPRLFPVFFPLFCPFALFFPLFFPCFPCLFPVSPPVFPGFFPLFSPLFFPPVTPVLSLFSHFPPCFSPCLFPGFPCCFFPQFSRFYSRFSSAQAFPFSQLWGNTGHGRDSGFGIWGIPLRFLRGNTSESGKFPLSHPKNPEFHHRFGSDAEWGRDNLIFPRKISNPGRPSLEFLSLNQILGWETLFLGFLGWLEGEFHQKKKGGNLQETEWERDWIKPVGFLGRAAGKLCLWRVLIPRRNFKNPGIGFGAARDIPVFWEFPSVESAEMLLDVMCRKMGNREKTGRKTGGKTEKKGKKKKLVKNCEFLGGAEPAEKREF